MNYNNDKFTYIYFYQKKIFRSLQLRSTCHYLQSIIISVRSRLQMDDPYEAVLMKFVDIKEVTGFLFWLFYFSVSWWELTPRSTRFYFRSSRRWSLSRSGCPWRETSSSRTTWKSTGPSICSKTLLSPSQRASGEVITIFLYVKTRYNIWNQRKVCYSWRHKDKLVLRSKSGRESCLLVPT